MNRDSGLPQSHAVPFRRWLIVVVTLTLLPLIQSCQGADTSNVDQVRPGEARDENVQSDEVSSDTTDAAAGATPADDGSPAGRDGVPAPRSEGQDPGVEAPSADSSVNLPRVDPESVPRPVDEPGTGTGATSPPRSGSDVDGGPTDASQSSPPSNAGFRDAGADGGSLDHLLVDGSLPSPLSCGDLECFRSPASEFCGTDGVAWVCEGFANLDIFGEQCVDLATQVPRFCCPESFLTNCP